MTRVTKIMMLRRRLALLPKQSRRRAPLERELAMLMARQIAAEHRQDRKEGRAA